MAASTTTTSPEQAQVQLEALLNGPAGTPPPGVMPNFNVHNEFDSLMAVTLALGVGLATLTMLLRMYTKAFLIRSLAYEDYAIVLGWLGQVGMAVPCVGVLKSRGGVHIWNVHLKDFFRMLYWVNMTSIFYDITVIFVKLSITLQLLRIFVPNRKGNLILFFGLHICIWTNFVFYLTNMGVLIALCRPREKIWKPYLPGQCYDSNASFLASGFFNVISDFVILLLPLPALWSLQMPLKRKAMLTAIFATAFFACITSIVRTYYTWMLVKTPDISYYMVSMGLWTIAEVSIGVIVSCLPVLPRFFQHFGPKVYKTFSLRSKSGTASEKKPKFGIPMSRRKAHPRSEQPFDGSGGNGVSNPWSQSYSPNARLTGEYITLGDPREETRISNGTPTEIFSTPRNDLEKAAWSPRRSQQA